MPLRNLRRAAGALVAAAAAATVLVSSSPPAGAAPPPFTWQNSSGLTATGTPAMVDLDGWWPTYQPDPRLWDVTVTSQSIFVPGTNPPPPPAVNPVHIPTTFRVYLPAGYDQNRAAGYPVLYILHGGAGQYSDWSDPGMGDITRVIGPSSPFKGIAVMVEGGKSGWYSDWVGQTDGNFRPRWETYHVDEVVGWVDHNLNTVPSASGRAIAGVSMGGLGSMSYAGRNLDKFSAVGSFSGAVEMRNESFQDTVSNSMWFYGATVGNQGVGQTEYRMTPGGSPEEEETARLARLFGPSTAPVPPETRPGWPSRNPVELAEAGAYAQYSGKLALYAGRSAPGVTGAGEDEIALLADDLDAALGSSFNRRYCTGYGTHDWKYWRNDLADFVQYVYGSSPSSTCTANGRSTGDRPGPEDDWYAVS